MVIKRISLSLSPLPPFSLSLSLSLCLSVLSHSSSLSLSLLSFYQSSIFLLHPLFVIDQGKKLYKEPKNSKESKAQMEYEEAMKMTHTTFKVEATGLHIKPEYPHLGASPDGLTSCSCCGDGILEIKCPGL